MLSTAGAALAEDADARKVEPRACAGAFGGFELLDEAAAALPVELLRAALGAGSYSSSSWTVTGGTL